MSSVAEQPRNHETGYAVMATHSQNSPSVAEMGEADEEFVCGAPLAYPNQIAHQRNNASSMRSDASVLPMMETTSEYDVCGEEYNEQDHFTRDVFFESGVSASNADPFDSPSPLFMGLGFGMANSEELDTWQLICRAREAKLERERELEELEARSTEAVYRSQNGEYEAREEVYISQQLQYRQGDTVQRVGNVVQYFNDFLRFEDIGPLEGRNVPVEGYIEEIRSREEALRARERVILEKEEEIRLKEQRLQLKERELERQSEDAHRLAKELERQEMEATKRASDMAAKEKSVAEHKQAFEKVVDNAKRLQVSPKKLDDQARKKKIETKRLEEDIAQMLSRAKKTEEAARRKGTDVKNREEATRKCEEKLKLELAKVRKMRQETAERNNKLLHLKNDLLAREEELRSREERAYCSDSSSLTLDDCSMRQTIMTSMRPPSVPSSNISIFDREKFLHLQEHQHPSVSKESPTRTPSTRSSLLSVTDMETYYQEKLKLLNDPPQPHFDMQNGDDRSRSTSNLHNFWDRSGCSTPRGMATPHPRHSAPASHIPSLRRDGYDARNGTHAPLAASRASSANKKAVK